MTSWRSLLPCLVGVVDIGAQCSSSALEPMLMAVTLYMSFIYGESLFLPRMTRLIAQVSCIFSLRLSLSCSSRIMASTMARMV